MKTLDFVLLVSILGLTYGDEHCSPRYYNQNSFVCACNRSDCTPLEVATTVPEGKIHVWESSLARYRLQRTEQDIKNLDWDPNYLAELRVRIDRFDKRQNIHGFGAAFTDAAGQNLLNLTEEVADRLLKDYFGHDGLRYSIARVPIGGTDFSARIYTYQDDHVDDFNMDHFALADEDYVYKIPFIKKALQLRSDLKLLGSAWSAPAWMKTNGDIKGSGSLKGRPGGDYYKAWARYYVKFLDAYKQNGINFWGITTGNEPTNALINDDFFFNCMGFTPEEMRDFIKLDLGPSLRDAGYGTDMLHVLMHDETREFLPNYTRGVLRDSEAASFVTGIGYHWYVHQEDPFYDNLAKAHQEFPNHFLLSTEACEGWVRDDPKKVLLGNWTRAENYASDMLEGLNNWSTGWLDWNLALNINGGPSWVDNWTDSPIIVMNGTYYKQPMYYALGHFSKFLPPGSIFLGYQLEGNPKGVKLAAFLDPSNQIVLVILNRSDFPVELVVDGFAPVSVPVKMSPHSIKTLVTPVELAA